MLRKIFIVALILFAANSIALAFSHDVKIVNDTGKNIAKIYLSTIALEEWQEISELNGEVLRDGESIDVEVNPENFRPNPIVRYFDIRAEFDDGSAEIYFGADLFNIAEISLKPNGKFSSTYEN